MQGLHAGAALLLKNPAWAISDTEALQLAKALKEVMKHHKVDIAPQTLAYINLAGCAAMIYGPKLAVIAFSKKTPQRQAAQHAQHAQPEVSYPTAPPGRMNFG